MIDYVGAKMVMMIGSTERIDDHSSCKITAHICSGCLAAKLYTDILFRKISPIASGILDAAHFCLPSKLPGKPKRYCLQRSHSSAELKHDNMASGPSLLEVLPAGCKGLEPLCFYP